jgi:endonuclease/exonuclease/phosphatase family metal-dependent hydrolase
VILLNTLKPKPIHVMISSLLLFIVLAAWMVTMFLTPFSGSHQEQLQQVVAHWSFFQISFGIALAIAPFFLYFIISLHNYLSVEISVFKAAGLTLAAGYGLCVSGAYGTQLTVLPYYLRRNMPAMAEIWFFNNPESLAYFINQTGYALWALAVLVLFGSEVKREGIRRWLGSLFILSALLSLAAYGGLLFAKPHLNALTLLSGALTIPITVLAFTMGVKAFRNDNEEDPHTPQSEMSEAPTSAGEATEETPVSVETDDESFIESRLTTEDHAVSDKALNSEMKNPEDKSSDQEKTRGSINPKKILIILGMMMIVIPAVVLGSFLGVVSLMNQVPEEREIVSVEQQQSKLLPVGEAFSIMTFNIGYGGLDQDQDFFMDGGIKSRSESLERTLENTREIIDFLTDNPSEIMLIQEIDIRSSRSFNVNQVEAFKKAFPNYAHAFGWNYRSLWVPVPVMRPMGYTDSGISTFSRYTIEQAVRYQLPGSEAWPRQLFDLDRCIVETRIPVENGQTLILVNLHLSAYDKGGKVREQQLGFLKHYLTEQAAHGHYVIAGGDWNHLLDPTQLENPDFLAQWPDWLMPLPEDFTPPGYQWMVDTDVYTVRDNATPYWPGKTFVTVIDGFLASENIRLHEVTGFDLGFANSDHNPVSVVLSLIPEDLGGE